MKEENKRIVFDYMGWCWHEANHEYLCKNCGRRMDVLCSIIEHPFDSNDMTLLKDKMVERGHWEKFLSSTSVEVKTFHIETTSKYFAELFTPERFFDLFIEWRKSL